MKGLNELLVAGWILFGLLLTPIIFGVMELVALKVNKEFYLNGVLECPK